MIWSFIISNHRRYSEHVYYMYLKYFLFNFHIHIFLGDAMLFFVEIGHGCKVRFLATLVGGHWQNISLRVKGHEFETIVSLLKQSMLLLLHWDIFTCLWPHTFKINTEDFRIFFRNLFINDFISDKQTNIMQIQSNTILTTFSVFWLCKQVIGGYMWSFYSHSSELLHKERFVWLALLHNTVWLWFIFWWKANWSDVC